MGIISYCTYTSTVVSFDAKIGFDDNAAFRQKAIFDQRDTAEEVCTNSIHYSSYCSKIAIIKYFIHPLN